MSLYDRSCDFKDRLIGEEQSSLPHGPDAAGETDIAEVVQEILRKNSLGVDIAEAVFAKAEVG